MSTGYISHHTSHQDGLLRVHWCFCRMFHNLLIWTVQAVQFKPWFEVQWLSPQSPGAKPSCSGHYKDKHLNVKTKWF